MLKQGEPKQFRGLPRYQHLILGYRIFVSVSETEVFNSFKKSFVNMMSYGYLENDFFAFSNYDQGQGLFEITFRNRVP